MSSVSSDGMMDQMAHIAEEGLHMMADGLAAGAGVVGHAAYDASAKVGGPWPTTSLGMMLIK